MKKIFKNVFTAALFLIMMLSLCACSDNWEAPYASLVQDGFTVSVRFDANGGMFAGTNDVSIVDVYSPSNSVSCPDGSVGFYLLSPDNPLRAEGTFSISRNGYFLAGWYTQCSPRVDDNGEPLDEYGVLCSISGREQGFTYSGLWDFDTDLLIVDASKSYTAEEPAQILYAAWIPYIPYEIYGQDASGQWSLIDTVRTIDLEVPEWNEKSGKLDLKKIPTVDGMTFDAAYLSADLSQPITETIRGTDSYVDYETGTLNVEAVPIFTTWLEGSWYKIYTAQQFYNNSRLDGNYLICADIDFEGAVWSPTLVKGKFTGKIYGNGYTFSNITAAQADSSQIYGGLFGTLESGAVIENLTFENVSLTVEAGSRMQGAAFGLLTGSLSSGAELTGVTVNGTLFISENCYPQSDYTIGLLCGSGSTDGVSYTIDCQTAEDNTDKLSITVDGDAVYVTFHS